MSTLRPHFDLSKTRLETADRNAAIHAIRCRIEKIFGTWKRSCGLRRMRRRGIAKPVCKPVSPQSPATSNEPSTSSAPRETILPGIKSGSRTAA
ncbi:transposase [Hoeflea sp.]|uniref:transposase n=1 Tax=Hoeflea sp. TaxID=1940281 RepID=UPI003B01E058